MNRDEETLFLRQMQEADKEKLQEHFHLQEVQTTKDGHILCKFNVNSQKDTGYLHLKTSLDYQLEAAEMNVNFQCTIGLNRSPLELRMLAEHVLDLFHSDIEASFQ